MTPTYMLKWKSVPWRETECEEIAWDHPVRWTRPGRDWTIEERDELWKKITNEWLIMFPDVDPVIGIFSGPAT